MNAESVADSKRRIPILIAELERAKSSLLLANQSEETIESTREKIGISEGLLRGETALAEGRFFTHEEVVLKMARWLK